MSMTLKVFGHWVSQMTKTDVPLPPHIHIVLDEWSTVANQIPAVTPQLASEAEIDWHIEALKADLDTVGRNAKAALRRAKEDTAKIVSDRNSN